MKNPNKKTRLHQHVYNSSVSCLDTLKYSKLTNHVNSSLRRVVDIYRELEYVIVKITNKKNGRVFIYIEDIDVAYGDSYDKIMETTNYPIEYDVRMYGWHNFTVERIAVFPDIKQAHFFMLHACNSLVDKGVYLYNDEILSGKYQKLIYMPVSIRTYDKILNYCIKNKIKYKKLITVLIRKFFLNEVKS